jgi:flavocytochrome c
VTDVDVIVVGSGAAGLAAALTAAEAGATVLVAEAEDVVGGSSRLSGASLLGAGSKLQAQLGIEDSPERLYHYYMTLNHWSTEPALVWQLAHGVGPAVDWLCDLGIEFDPKVYRAGEEDVPRKHVPLGGGEQIIAVLQERVQQAGGDVALRRRVDRLLLDDAGQLVGAAVGDDEVTAHAVVVTTGGFGANSELIERYLPQTADAGDWLWYIGAPGSRGDALLLGEQVGAQIAGEDLCQLMLTPNFGNLLEGGYFPGWLVLVNASGRRFFDESSSFSVTQPIVRAQKGPVWAIFDRGAKDAAAPATAGQRKRPDAKERDYYFKKWVTPVLDEMIDKGVVLQAQTVEELAGLIGVPERNLTGTIERYNADFDAGADQMFFKSHALMRRVSDPPYYATELRLAHLSVTATGLRIDPEAHVLDEASAPIPGLFAAGECTGGVLGEVYVGNGNAYSNSLVFGRIAGAQAAERARQMRQPTGSPRKCLEGLPEGP